MGLKRFCIDAKRAGATSRTKTTRTPASWTEEVTVTASYYGGEPDPKPLVKIADARGLAGFALPDRPDPLYEASATATARTSPRTRPGSES